MEGILRKIFVKNFYRKVFSLLVAIAIWGFVNASITVNKVFTKVPVRIVNLPPEKTIRGLMPNGILDRKLTITLTGKKDVIDNLKKNDFEIVIDASGKGDEWIVHLSKKNLVSVNPDVDLFHNITSVSHNEFILKLSKLVTEKIPVFFAQPKGEPPEGYQYLDVWPQKVTHTLSGPEEDIQKLQKEGLEITFDLNLIPKDELDALKSDDHMQTDEVSFPVPDSWKRVAIPFLGGMKQEINGSEAKYLRIDFLRKELLPLDRDIPIWVFYPLPSTQTLNPNICPLLPSKWIADENGLTIINRPLYVGGVSRLFLDVVRDRIMIVIVADPKNKGDKPLSHQVEFVNPPQLENEYVQKLMAQSGAIDVNAPYSDLQKQRAKEREKFYKNRFREYSKSFQLFEKQGKPFRFFAYQKKNGVLILDTEIHEDNK